MLPAGNCAAPEHDPCITSELSTTARWNEMWVIFAEGGKLKYPEKTLGARLKLTNLIPHLSSGFDPGTAEVERHEPYHIVILPPPCKLYIVFTYGINLI